LYCYRFCQPGKDKT